MAQSAVLDSAPAAGARSGVWRMVALLAAVSGAAGIGQYVMAFLIPGVKASFHASDTQVSLVSGAAYAVCHAGALLVCGRLADRWNRRNLLLIGIVGWGLALLAGGFAQTFMQLMGSRIALGIFQGVLGPVTISMLVDRTPVEVRGRAIGLMAAGGSIGGAASQFIGGGLMQVFSARPPVHLFGLAFVPWQSVLVVCSLPSLLLAPLLLAVREPARHALPEAAPFRPLSHIRAHAGVFVPILLASGLFMMAAIAQGAWSGVYFMRSLHMAPALAGATLGVNSLLGALVAGVLGGYLSDRSVGRDPDAGRLKLLILLMPLGAVQAMLLLATAYPVVAIASFFLIAILGTMNASLVTTILPELVPSEGRGRVLAIFGFITVLGGMGLAPTLVALVTDHVLKDENKLPLSLVLVSAPAFLLAMVLTLAALPGARRLRRHIRELPGEA